MKDRIKEIRKAAKLNQTEFGAKIGVKGNTIGNYEVGLRNPSDAVIFSICREFNVNEEWIRTGTGSMYKPMSDEDEIGEILTDLLVDVDDSVYKFIKSMLRTYKKLDDKSKEVIRNSTDLFIEELKKEG